jgi:hypothetical protein
LSQGFGNDGDQLEIAFAHGLLGVVPCKLIESILPELISNIEKISPLSFLRFLDYAANSFRSITKIVNLGNIEVEFQNCSEAQIIQLQHYSEKRNLELNDYFLKSSCSESFDFVSLPGIVRTSLIGSDNRVNGISQLPGFPERYIIADKINSHLKAHTLLRFLLKIAKKMYLSKRSSHYK